MRKKKTKILAILPISIGGRLTMNSIIDGFKQNECSVTVFDNLFGRNFNELLSKKYDYIAGYDYDAIQIKDENNLKLPTINYFSDDIRSKTSGPDWEKYLPHLEYKDNHTFYWDRTLTNCEKFKNIHYLPHFVNFDIYKSSVKKPKFDIMFAGRLDTEYRLSFFEELISALPNLHIAWYAIEKHYQDARSRAKFPELIDLCYRGFIDNEKDMAKAINNSKIVFNMNSQGISSLNYRTFQTVACKKLMISDYREELDLFEGNMPFYEDFSDLIFKIENYLDDNEAYNKVTEECYKIAQQSHSSRNCVRYMLKTLSK